MYLKARNWHIGFDKTWFADAFKDWSGHWIVLVSVVERLATPRPKRSFDTALACNMGWKEAEPYPACPVRFIGLILFSQPVRNVRFNQTGMQNRLDALTKHRSVRQPHSARSYLTHFSIGEASAVVSVRRVVTKDSSQSADSVVILGTAHRCDGVTASTKLPTPKQVFVLFKIL